MAFEPFGLVGGLSVGIPSILVIDENGNFVANVSTTGNVSANVISANTFKFANGANLTTNAAGSNTEVQFNDNGSFAADPSFTFDSTQALLTVSNLYVSSTANLGDVSNVSILGGLNGYFLQTDGAGSLTWAPAGNGGGGNGSPGGSNTQVQYNNAGDFGGDAGFTYNDVTNTLHVGNISATTVTANLVGNATRAGTVTTNAQPNITSVGTLTSLSVSGTTTLGNSVSANYFVGRLYGAANTAGTVTTNAQPNITSVGTLTSLAVTGNVTASNFVGNVSGTANTAITVTANNQPNITSVGTLTNLTASGDSDLGNAVTANFFIGDGGYLSNLQISNASVSNANYASYAGNVTLAGQSNITSLGTLTSLTVSGTTTLGNSVSANYFVGRLYGAANTVVTNAQPNITSLGTLVELGVTGNITSGNILAGNLVSANYFTGTLTTHSQPNITSVGTLTGLGVNGTLTAVNITSNTGTFTGNGIGLHHLTGANVTGTVANANYATWSDSANTAVTVTRGAQPNISSVGPLVTLEVVGNIYVDTNSYLGNIAQANYFVGNANGLSNITAANITGTVANANYAAYAGNVNVANTVRVNAQPNITSVGTLTSLEVSGTSNFAGNVTIANTGIFRPRGNVNMSSSPNVYVGNVANFHITGGFDGYVLTTDGTGNLSWTVGGGNGGGGTPGGANMSIQFNANGDFGGSDAFLFDTTSNVATLYGDFVANSVQVGVDIYKFATTSIQFATTASTGAGQVLYQVPVANLAGAEFHIIGTDPSGPSRQSIKLTAVYYDGTVQYSEYAGLYINGGVGNFDVEYYPGSDPVPPSLRLTVAPNTNNNVSYKIMVTLFSE